MTPVAYPQGRQAICANASNEDLFRHSWLPPGFLLTPDAAGFLAQFQPLNDGGENIYIPIATFRDDVALDSYKGRKQANVLGCGVLVVDLDYLKHGRDKAWAVALLDTIVAQWALPAPTLLVDTGGGLHGWWHLTQVLPPADWLPLAHRLAAVWRQVNQVVGRCIDTQCTVDICRVLRVPGFRNNKYATRPLVTVLRQGAAPVPVEDMQAALASYDPGPMPAVPALAGFFPGAPESALASQSAFAVALQGEPAEWGQIRDKSLIGMGCEVLRTVLADNNAAGYEVWAGLLSVIQYTDGGDAALEAVSAGHTDYGVKTDLASCRAKAATFHSPRTCAQFAEHMPDACARCPNRGKFKSPIMLGRGGARIERVAPAAAPAATPTQMAATAMVGPPDTLPEPPQVEPMMPAEPPAPEVLPPIDRMFRYREKTGEVEMRQDTDTPGVVAYGVIVNRPVWLEYTLGDRVCLGMFDRAGTKHTREFDSTKLLAGNDWGALVAWLTVRGVHPMFTASKTNLTLHPIIMLIKSLVHAYGAERALREVVSFGPSREVAPDDFVLGFTRYKTEGEPEQVRIPEDSPLAEHAVWMGMLPREECQALALEYARRMATVYSGEEWRMDRFIIASALAASLSPFLIPREMQGGVMVVSSPTSGEAKSATLTTAAGLYTGNPSNLRRIDATVTAVFKTLLPRLNAVPLMLDDWDKQAAVSAHRDLGGALTELITRTTSLRPKALANGEVTPGWWSTWIYLATNSDVATQVGRTEGGGMAAGMRYLDIPIPSRQDISPEAQAAYEQFRVWRETNSGQTAHAWLRHVMPHLTYLRTRYAYWIERIRNEHPALGTMAARFLRAMVACTATGAEAAHQLGLLPWAVDEVFATGCQLMARQLVTTETVMQVQDGIIPSYLAANLSRTINVANSNKSLLTSAHELAAAVGANDTVMIPVTALSDWLRRNGKSDSHLRSRLKRQHPDMRIEPVRIPVAGLILSIQCYVLTLEGITGRMEAADLAFTPPQTAPEPRVH